VIFPAPRRLERLGGTGNLAALRTVEDGTLRAQGYVLEVRGQGATLRHRDAAGRRYGLHTLAQLRRARVEHALRIEDWPEFAHRGFMLDVSRDRVPTRDTLAWLVEVLAELRLNQLQLYVEHTFTFAGHDAVWRDASPLTPDDLVWLDRLAAEHGIELVANLNTFGHMGRWLAHDAYRERAECPDGYPSLWGSGTDRPGCLAPTEDNARFAVGLARELLACLGSRRIHIGGDEPFELGLGRSRADVERRGRDQIYVEHLGRLLRPLIETGHDVLFWADLFRRRADLFTALPAGATGVVWHYEAPDEIGWTTMVPAAMRERLGLPDDAERGFAAHVRTFVEAGRPFWVAPGTSTWNAIAGRWPNARGNLLDAATVGAEAGARGYLITDWGDNGHWQPLPVSLLPLAYGAGVAWCAATNAGADVAPVVDRVLGDPEGRLAAHLVRLGELAGRMGLTSPNASPIWAALAPDHRRALVGQLDVAGHAHALEVASEAAAHFAARPLPGPRGEAMCRELAAACQLTRLGLLRLGDLYGRTRAACTAVAVRSAIVAQRAAWLASSRPGGLEDSLGWLAGLAERLP
jgi:hypothetical protein